MRKRRVRKPNVEGRKRVKLTEASKPGQTIISIYTHTILKSNAPPPPRMYSVGLASEKEDGKMSVVHRQAEVQRHLMQGSSASKGSDLAMFNEHMRERGEDDYIEIDSEGEVDVEVEKLLNWSENLDFDGYTRNWGMIGTSGTSSVRGTVENTMESYVAYEEAKSKETKEWESQGLEEEEFFDYGLGL